MMDQIKMPKSSQDKTDSPKEQDPTTVVLANKKAPPLEGGNLTKNMACGLSNMRPAHKNSMNSSSR